MELQESSVIRDIVPQLLNFRAEKRSFVLLNSAPKVIEPFWGGTKFIIPACDKLHTEKDKREMDADGDPIPGSIIISDLPGEVNPHTGEPRLAVDSQEAVRHILGIHRNPDGSVSSAMSPYALGGLSLLPRHPTKELWKAVMQDGSNRNFLIRVQNAQTTIEEYDAKNAARASAGMPPVHGGKVYMQSRAILDEYNKIVTRETQLSVNPVEAQDADDDLEFEVYAKARVMELTSKAAESKAIDKTALAKELLDDPTVLAKLRKTYRIRKVGHMEVSDEALAAAAQSGQTISEIGV